MKCPSCQGTRIVKNGSIHNGKPKWLCKDCRRQFVAQPTNRRISLATKQTVDKLLLERLSLAGIVRSTHVSARWLQYYVNKKYANVPRSLELSEQKKGPSFWNVTSYGHLWARRNNSNGYGLP